MDFTKVCAECANSYYAPGEHPYRRCKKAVAAVDADGSLCGEMRLGPLCGPAATLHEPIVRNDAAEQAVLLERTQAAQAIGRFVRT